jgi:aryl sulfotransferase
VRDLPKELMLYFPRLRRDLAGEIGRIACFLDIPIDEARFPAIVYHCSFDYMKKNATESTPLGGVFWDGGAETNSATFAWYDPGTI